MPGTFELNDISWERVILTLDVTVPDVMSVAPLHLDEIVPSDAEVIAPGKLTTGDESVDGLSPDVASAEALSPDEIDEEPLNLGDGGLRFFLAPVARPLAEMRPVESEDLGDSRYRLTINVTRFGKRSQVPNGTYLVVAVRGTEVGFARFPLNRVGELDDRSRAFVYNKNFSAYTVTFGISDDEEAPNFLIRTYAFGRSGGKKKGIAGARAKAKKRWKKTKRSALLSARDVARATRKKDKKTILFASEARPNMQGNLKAVHDRMVERGLDKDFDFRYSFRTEQTSTRENAFHLAWEMGRADIVLIDDYFAILGELSDPENQRIIQLWHAGVGFKSIGYSRFGQYGSPHLTNSHRLYTYTIAGSQHLRDVYSEAFGIEREAVIATGLPRIDSFLREGRAEEVLAAFERDFPAAAGKRKILLAPTFRGRGAGDAHYNYDSFDFEALYEACGEDSVVLFRQHHFLRDPAPIPSEFQDRLIDVASFPDTNDLLLISDVMITDYSSIIYEYALLKRPMIFYAYDLENYSATRGMHRDYRESAPGPIATTFDELLALIQMPELSTEKTEEFVRENFDFVDTHNSDRVIDWLILGDPPEYEEEALS